MFKFTELINTYVNTISKLSIYMQHAALSIWTQMVACWCRQAISFASQSMSLDCEIPVYYLKTKAEYYCYYYFYVQLGNYW